MNSIGAQAAAPVEVAVPAATSRVSNRLADVENLISSLEARLKSVLEPESESNAGAALPPAHPVPLAHALHEIADRAGFLANRVESLLNRLHV
jgi:hypothetical protein